LAVILRSVHYRASASHEITALRVLVGVPELPRAGTTIQISTGDARPVHGLPSSLRLARTGLLELRACCGFDHHSLFRLGGGTMRARVGKARSWPGRTGGISAWSCSCDHHDKSRHQRSRINRFWTRRLFCSRSSQAALVSWPIAAWRWVAFSIRPLLVALLRTEKIERQNTDILFCAER
jgi:hypothetical protein